MNLRLNTLRSLPQIMVSLHYRLNIDSSDAIHTYFLVDPVATDLLEPEAFFELRVLDATAGMEHVTLSSRRSSRRTAGSAFWCGSSP